MQKVGVSSHQTACIGDDSIDLPAFKVCGLSYAVNDAPTYIKSNASGVLKARGGNGAFPELGDAILISKGKERVLTTTEGFSEVMLKMTHQN